MLRSKEKRKQFWFKLIQAGVLVNSGDMHFLQSITTMFFIWKALQKLVKKDGTSNMFYDPTGMFALATDGINSL